MPASAVVALERVGFCRAEVKPFGPVHEYVAPATVGVESAIVAPAQYGPPFEAVGVAGVAFTMAVVGSGARGAAADGDGHRVDAGISRRGAGARRILESGCEAVRTRPRVRGAGDRWGRERDR